MTVCERDLSNDDQTKLYLLHPLSEDFMALMTSVLTTTHVMPNFVSPTWVVWWLRNQEEYVEVVVEYVCDGYGFTSMLTKDSIRDVCYDEDSEDSEDDSLHNLEYTNYEGLCDKVDDHHSILWCTNYGSYVVPMFKPIIEAAGVNHSVRAATSSHFSYFISSSRLYKRDKGKCVIQMFTYTSSDMCELHNFISKGLPEFTTWYHEEGTPFRYFVDKIHLVELMMIKKEIVVQFKVDYTVVLEWAYHQFMDHHIDRIKAYRNDHWSLDELKTYAKDTWSVTGDSREGIVSEVERIIFNTSDWVEQLTIDKLVSK